MDGTKPVEHEHVASPRLLLHLVVAASHGKGSCWQRSLAGTKQVAVRLGAPSAEDDSGYGRYNPMSKENLPSNVTFPKNALVDSLIATSTMSRTVSSVKLVFWNMLLTTARMLPSLKQRSRV